MNGALNYEELFNLIESIKEQIEKEIIRANRVGTLKKVLEKYNFEVEEYFHYESIIAKVLIIGQ